MAGVSIKVKVDEDTRDLLRRVQDLLEHPSEAMAVIGTVITESVTENFLAGGRPERWKPSKAALKRGGRTLVDSTRLMNSITYQAEDDRVTVGTNTQYAAIHHFGFKGRMIVPAHQRLITQVFGKELKQPKHIRVRTHTRLLNLPARPFMLVQAEDYERINQVLVEYLNKQIKA